MRYTGRGVDVGLDDVHDVAEVLVEPGPVIHDRDVGPAALDQLAPYHMGVE